MGGFFRLFAAGPMFFVSAWLLMIFAGIVSGDVGIRPFGYLTSMVVTIGLWLVMVPAIGAVGRGGRKDDHGRRGASWGGGGRWGQGKTAATDGK